MKFSRNNGINYDPEIRQGKLPVRDTVSPLIEENSSHLVGYIPGALDITA